MKAGDSFDVSQANKLRRFIQSFQLILHNDQANFFSDSKRVVYSTCVLTGSAGKWNELFLSNISNEDPSYLLNSWHLFKTQLFTIFGDPNESRKAEQEFNKLRTKESGHVSLYIADFRSSMSKIGDLGERNYTYLYQRCLASILLDQLASQHSNFDSLQELMDINLEVVTSYHERKREKGSLKEKKPPANGSNCPRPPQDSSFKRLHHKKDKQEKNFPVSKDKPHSSLLNKYNKSIYSEEERRIKKGLCGYYGERNQLKFFFMRPQKRPG
ncbi:hypothetical protein O181_092442 [Austropuccinia psidii MF-1]|uniref:Ty3 transposon capsid-like protein domain-containing protein n=1 Tax=Austropuccinia psidii MF-1 TaxID=1389203 RepID=A0A9Q3P9J8_9BASI|nr:hypothetical protein [Austropuccinia psidii MF-1]